MGKTPFGPSCIAVTATVRAEVNTRHGVRDISVVYQGPAEELIALGCATAELLAHWPKGKTRRDADGHRAILYRRKGWVDLHLVVPIARALQLPGVTLDLLVTAQQFDFEQCPHLVNCSEDLRYCDLGLGDDAAAQCVKSILARFTTERACREWQAFAQPNEVRRGH